ncbi:MAG: T9SS type A sorting domain-containing protein [Ignavibacterium sp.]|nr:T9SS type A sorting domain-containing protein [Ignavibacterium sp.]
MRKLILTVLTVVFSISLGYSQVTTLWEKSVTAGSNPFWNTGSLTRGISFGTVGGNNYFFVVTRNASLGGKQIIYYDALTGDSLGQLDNTGITGGVAVVNDVEVSSDGKIFVSNMTTNASSDAFKVYKYDSLSAAPVVVISYNTAAERLGDKFTVEGSTADNSIIIWAADAVANSGVVHKFTTTDNGVSFTPTTVDIGSPATASSAAVGPLSDGSFYWNSHGTAASKYDNTGTLIGSIPTTVLGTGGSAIRYFGSFLNNEYIVANALGTGIENAKIIKVPGGVPASAELFAQTPMLGPNSAGGLGDVSIQKINNYTFNVFVLSTNNGFGAYQVDLRTPLAGDYYIPQGANPKGFATIFDAVTSLNINGASGTVNFLLDADTLRENSFTFNANLSAVNNVVVKPAPGRDVVLIVTPGASMGNGSQMIGFDRGHVTFDGSNNGSSSQNLIVTTETNDTRVPFGLNTSNADTVTIKNLIIKNIFDVALNFRYGVVINDKNDVWGLRVENCQIGTPEKPVRRDGIAPWGSTAPNQFSLINNEIYCGTRGVATLYLIDSDIIGNKIYLLPTTAGATDAYNHGIYITGANGTINIKENYVNCLEKTINATSYIIGIAFAGNGNTTSDVINVFNNMVNVGASNETRNVYGIGLRSAQAMGNLNIYHNTIVVNEMSSPLVSYAIGNHTNGTGSVNLDLLNNIIINNHTGNTSSAAIGLNAPMTTTLSSDYNVLLANSILVSYQGTNYTNLASWQTTTQDSNSISKVVNFVSATDLHLAGTSNGDVDLVGTPISEITIDIDGDLRSTTSPYKGSDEASLPIPVELTAFSAVCDNGAVILQWTTATETNNKGFEIQRKVNDEFEVLSFVDGIGTTTSSQSYSYTDRSVSSGLYSYRLKQVDYNGSFTYSNIIEVNVTTPSQFELSQNYPNPFNPTTKINYTIPFDSKVTISVYSVTGELIAELVNDFVTAGAYSVDFDGRNLASGIYIYKMTAGNFTQTNKMMLMK